MILTDNCAVTSYLALCCNFKCNSPARVLIILADNFAVTSYLALCSNSPVKVLMILIDNTSQLCSDFLSCTMLQQPSQRCGES